MILPGHFPAGVAKRRIVGGASPLDVAGLAHWLRADTGLFTTSGGSTPAVNDLDRIGRWEDQAGFSIRNQAQSTDSLRPRLRTGQLNGHPAVQFGDASAQRGLIGANMSALTAGESFMVLKVDADPPTAGFGMLWHYGTFVHEPVYPFTDGTIHEGFGTDARPNTGNPAQSLTVWHVYNCRSSGGTLSMYIAGGLHFSGAIGNPAFPASARLGYGNASSEFFMGLIAELIVYDHVLSAGDRATVESYLNDRYGL